MKATIYTLILVLSLFIVSYFIYKAQHPIKFVPSGDFDTDDQRLYTLIRADMQAYELKIHGDTLAWLDNMVRQNYATSFVGSNKSKTAAYVKTVQSLQPKHPKSDYYSALLTNLTNRYK